MKQTLIFTNHSTDKQRKGVITLPSGVQYKVISQGNDLTPTHSDTVEIELHTHTIDGQPVAYSGPKGETSTFLIKGLAEVIQLLQTGAKGRSIPP
jgi:FKBP-type peptidyl-prolyl cis-trans isomerase FklB